MPKTTTSAVPPTGTKTLGAKPGPGTSAMATAAGCPKTTRATRDVSVARERRRPKPATQAHDIPRVRPTGAAGSRSAGPAPIRHGRQAAQRAPRGLPPALTEAPTPTAPPRSPVRRLCGPSVRVRVRGGRSHYPVAKPTGAAEELLPTMHQVLPWSVVRQRTGTAQRPWGLLPHAGEALGRDLPSQQRGRTVRAGFGDALRGYAFPVHRRDNFCCRYCGLDGRAAFANWLSLSWDHLLPKGHPDRDNIGLHRHGLHVLQHGRQ